MKNFFISLNIWFSLVRLDNTSLNYDKANFYDYLGNFHQYKNDTFYTPWNRAKLYKAVMKHFPNVVHCTLLEFINGEKDLSGKRLKDH